MNKETGEFREKVAMTNALFHFDGTTFSAGELRKHRRVASLTAEVRAVWGFDNLEAAWDRQDGCRLGTIFLTQARHARLAADRTPDSFIPFVSHGPRV
jgi:hypothetical protein